MDIDSTNSAHLDEVNGKEGCSPDIKEAKEVPRSDTQYIFCCLNNLCCFTLTHIHYVITAPPQITQAIGNTPNGAEETEDDLDGISEVSSASCSFFVFCSNHSLRLNHTKTFPSLPQPLPHRKCWQSNEKQKLNWEM
jgi:hypothetical protein